MEKPGIYPRPLVTRHRLVPYTTAAVSFKFQKLSFPKPPPPPPLRPSTRQFICFKINYGINLISILRELILSKRGLFRKFERNLLGTFALLVTFCNIENIKQESFRENVCPCICRSHFLQMHLLINH